MVWSRLRSLMVNLFRRSQVEGDLHDEVSAFLEQLVGEKVAAGMSEEKARREARLELGGVEQVKEQVRDARAGALLEHTWQDVRYGVRLMRRNLGVTAVAVITLALGIGANTAIFSFADALLLRPLPVREPSQLVSLFHVATENAQSYSPFSVPDYLELRDQNEVFSGLAAYSAIQVDLGSGAQAERVDALIVSGNYFSVLGVDPTRGRAFLPEEDRTLGTHPVIVISNALWHRRFGADPAAIGKTLTLNQHAFTVIGIAPPTLKSLDVYSAPDVWVPLMMHGEAMPGFTAFGTELFGNRGTHWVDLIGRLRAGTNLAAAGAAVRTIAQWQGQQYPDTNRAWSISVVPANEARLGPPTSRPVARLTGLLVALAGLVLLIACANVANLLMAKSLTRQKEIGIRLAVGAARARLIRQLVTESLMLALLGGAAGVLLAAWTTGVLEALEVRAMLPGLQLHLDVRVLGFALALSVLTGVAFGSLPALQASKVNIVQAVKDAGLSGPVGPRPVALRQVLVVGQVALCLILLVAAGLIVRTVANLQRVPLGYDAENLWLTAVDLSQRGYSEAGGRALYRQLLERVRALPGVQSVSLGFITPFSSWRMANDVFWQKATGDRSRTNVDINVVDIDYFQTLHIRLVRGRAFTEEDQPGTPGVAVVNEAMAARLWPREDPLGKRLWLWGPQGDDQPVVVVGVAKNGRYYRGWRTEGLPFMFLPFSQHYQPSMALHVRSTGAASLTPAAIRHEVLALDENIPALDFKSVTQARASSIALERMGAKLLSAFALLAIVLAAIGIYGTVSFSVSERTHEVGLRMALGAERSQILRLVIAGSARPVLAGVAVGWAAAFSLARVMSNLLFGVRPTDPVTFAAMAGVLIAVGLLASYVPARRATLVAPMAALRAE